ncbi:Asp-tRNA(Asn)/Glu-tRNA(Gln) amidotransferase subunit GatC [Mycoplasma sp. AC157]
MKREEIIELAKILKLIPNDEVILSLEKEFDEIYKMLNEFKQIDVSNVEPLVRLTKIKDFSLVREDEVAEYTENKGILLKNAPAKNENFVQLERVINDKK